MVEKSYRIIGGKARWVVVDENGIIINSDPNKGELKKFQEQKKLRKRYNDKNRCEKILDDGTICGRLFENYPYKEYDINGSWTGKWLCYMCYKAVYNNIIKSLCGQRLYNLDPKCSKAKGYMFEELTCRWRGVKNMNKESDNYCSFQRSRIRNFANKRIFL